MFTARAMDNMVLGPDVNNFNMDELINVNTDIDIKKEIFDIDYDQELSMHYEMPDLGNIDSVIIIFFLLFRYLLIFFYIFVN